MGGKTGTTTQSVQIPPQVLARYNAVNTRAEQVAQTPFQPYQGQFVAGLTPTQQAGVQATNQYAQTAQPYYSTATQQLGQAQGQGQQALQAAFGSLGAGVGTGAQYAQAATQGIGGALQSAQPYQLGATAAAMAAGQGIQPGQLQTQQYMNPYTQAVAQTTQQALQQQQQEQMAGQLGNAIRSGAFGGDRAALAAANLARQQQLGMAQAMAPIYQQGYGQALQTAQQQQGVELSAAQANRAALQNLSQQLQGIGQQGYGQQMGAAQQMAALGQQQFGQGLGAAQQLGALGQQQYGMGAGTAQQLAALGSGAQQAALQGAQAQLGAGTLEQQTQQADLTARYQQFLQERGYPFQVAQFLANIAMGTGALSGQTTTTTQPMPFFSDRRVKDDVKEIGKTHDGQPIYSFKYKGDDATRIGLMAQDVEKKHPEAVYDMGGVKGVDYKQATEAAERPERYEGGLVPASMGGAVVNTPTGTRVGYSLQGAVDPNDIQALLAQQQESFGPFGEGGIYGGSQHQAPFSNVKGVVPTARMHVPKMMQPSSPPPLPEGLGAQALSAYDQAMGMKRRYDEAKQMFSGDEKKDVPKPAGQGGIGSDAAAAENAAKADEEKSLLARIGEMFFAEGGVVPRQHYALGGSKDPSLPYEEDDKSPYKYFPTEILETEKPELQKTSQAPAPTSQTGIGLGTILGLFLKDGGSVPRGHLQTGGVYDPTMGRMVSTEMSPLEELNKEDIYSRELQPAAAPRFRVFERLAREEGAKGVKPTELYRSPERSAMLDLTMPTGAPRAKPYESGHTYGLAVDYSGIKPENYEAIQKAAKATGLTSGLNFKNPDAPHIQLGKGGYGGLYNQDVNIDEGFGQRSQSGVVPAEAQEAAYAKAREMLASKGIEPDSKQGQSMLPQVANFLQQNQSWLSPLGAGIRGMVQSKSPFFGGALLEGIGTGLEAVSPTQERIANIGQTIATTESTRAGIPAKAFNEDGSINVMDEQGRIFAIDPNEYRLRRMRGEKITYYLGKETPAVAPKGLQKAAEETIQKAEEAVQGEKPQGEKTVTTPQGKVTIGDPMALNDSEKGQIKQELTSLFAKYPTDADLDKMKVDRTNLRKYINASAQASELQRRNITYADLLQSRGQKGIFVGGPFAETLSGLAASLDQFSKASGGQGFAPDQNATVEDAIKLYNQLVQQARAKDDSKTLGELSQVAKTYPFITASGPGAAKTMAEVIVQTQEPIYASQLATNMMEATGSLGGVNLRGEYVGGTFENIFRDKFNKIATEDRKAIQKLLETRSGRFEKDQQGKDDPNRPISLFSSLARISRIRQSEAEKLAKDFMNGDMRIFNYFPNLQIVPD